MHSLAYRYWRDALEGRFGPITETDPQCGFWRVPERVWLPVAIWRDEMGLLWARIGNEQAYDSRDDIAALWLKCARYPVTEEAYRHAVETGNWPGEAPAERGLGDNAAPSGHEALVEAVRDQAAEVSAWLKGRRIESAADADRCETWSNAILKLKKQAEAEHKTEKAPHLEAGRKVDTKYKGLIDDAAKAARSLKDAVTPYLTARQREKEAAAAEAIAAGADGPVRTNLRATTSGTSGRKLSLREERTAEIEDLGTFVSFLAERKNPELLETAQAVANKFAKAGVEAPGIRIKIEQKAA